MIPNDATPLPCQGLMPFNIESRGLCLYAQIHIGFAAVFGGIGLSALTCMASSERWPATGIMATGMCFLMGMGPECLLVLCALCIYRTLRRHSMRTQLDDETISSYQEDSTHGEQEEHIPTADHPVGIPVRIASFNSQQRRQDSPV
jgi:hypothetical protein